MCFYEALLCRRPRYIDALIVLGEIYTRKGLFAKGLEVDRRLADLKPDNPIVHYNLACSLSLLGDITAALEAIKKAVRLGYNDFQYMNRDPDLRNLRRDERFGKFFRQLEPPSPRTGPLAHGRKRKR
ncbi:MAG: TPR end-of-group domain-containing protein [Deltaproteobacteria bacterium]